MEPQTSIRVVHVHACMQTYKITQPSCKMIGFNKLKRDALYTHHMLQVVVKLYLPFLITDELSGSMLMLINTEKSIRATVAVSVLKLNWNQAVYYYSLLEVSSSHMLCSEQMRLLALAKWLSSFWILSLWIL